MVTQDTAEVVPLAEMHLCWKHWYAETTLVAKTWLLLLWPRVKGCCGKYHDSVQTRLKQKEMARAPAGFKSCVVIHLPLQRSSGYKRNYQRNVLKSQMLRCVQKRSKVPWYRGWTCVRRKETRTHFRMQVTQMSGNQDVHRIGVHLCYILK